MIDRDFIDGLRDNLKTDVVSVNGKEYVTKPVFHSPKPEEWKDETLKLTTLTGFVDFCTKEKLLSDNAACIHVESEAKVSVVSIVRGTFLTRTVFAMASPILPAFAFGQYLSHSEFMIALQSKFMDFGDKAAILRVLGTVREEAVKTSMDDGVTQKVTASAGIVLQSEVNVPNPVILKPYRTFLEVDQPPSQFVLRVRSDKSGDLPSAALFEADGGRWRNEAMVNIAEYLTERIKALPVIR